MLCYIMLNYPILYNSIVYIVIQDSTTISTSCYVLLYHIISYDIILYQIRSYKLIVVHYIRSLYDTVLQYVIMMLCYYVMML